MVDLAMTKVVLDSEAFKALASDTRLQILKSLDVRRLTVSELGRLLNLNKATVFEHLKQLTAAELVKKDDEGRKWIYYRLTWKGKNILHPENAQIFLTLGVAGLGLSGAVFAVGRALDWWMTESAAASDPQMDFRTADAPKDDSAESSAPGGAPPEGEPADSGAGDAFWMDLDFIFFAVFLMAAVVLAGVAFMAWRRRNRERADVRHQLAALDSPKA